MIYREIEGSKGLHYLYCSLALFGVAIQSMYILEAYNIWILYGIFILVF